MQWLSISFVCSNISEVIYNHHTPNSLLPCQGRQYSGGGGLSTAFCTLPSIKVLHNLYFSTEGLQLCLSFFSTAPIKGSGRGGWGATWGPASPFLGLMNTSVFFNKCPIHVCASCSWRCPGTFAPSVPHLKLSLFLCRSRSKIWVEVKGPRRDLCQLKKPFEGSWLGSYCTVGRVFFPQKFCGHCYSFLAEMGRIPCNGRPESSSSIIW